MATLKRIHCPDGLSRSRRRTRPLHFVSAFARRQFSFLSSSMLRPQCVDISERIAELTLPTDQAFVRLQDRKRALKLVANAHLGYVPRSVSQLILHSNHNGNAKNGQHGNRHFTKDEVAMLKAELSKMDKLDEAYIREPAPNLNMLHPQGVVPSKVNPN